MGRFRALGTVPVDVVLVVAAAAVAWVTGAITGGAATRVCASFARCLRSGSVAEALAALFLALYGCVCAWRVAMFLLAPSDLVGRDTDPIMGTDSSRGREKLEGSPPPPFPRSWFRLVDSADVPPGSCVRLRRLGQNVVVARAAGGGAATVCGAESGGAWATREANGHVYAFYPGGGPPEPDWEPPAPAELNGGYTFHGRSENTVTAHVCEIPENGADVAHLPVLHRDFIVAPLRFLFHHIWDVTWRPGRDGAGGESAKCAYVNIQQAVGVAGGWELPGTRLNVDIVQRGLGIVTLKFRTPFGFVYVVETVTPVEASMQKFHHAVWAEWRVPRTFAKVVLYGLLAQAERDVPIWNHKCYRTPPMVVRGDGPIAQFRRWSKQFFVQ